MRLLIQKLFVALIFSATALPPLTATAASLEHDENTPWYEIEVIIFSHSDTQAIDTEKWPETLAPKDHESILDLRFADDPSFYTDQAIPSFTEDTLPVSGGTGKNVSTAPKAKKPVPVALPWVFLEPDELKLRKMADKLRLSNSAVPMLHIAWRQPTLAPDKSVPVFVYDYMTRRDRANARGLMMHRDQPNPGEDQASAQNQSAFGGNASMFDSNGMSAIPVNLADMEGPGYYRMSGTLRLSVSRYLHLESDLKLRLPVMLEETYSDAGSYSADSDSDNGNSGGFGSFFGVNQSQEESVTWTEDHEVLQTFRLAESRRLRSREIHFLDHPLFGVIVQVIPFEAYPEDDAVEEITIEDAPVRSLIN